MSYISDYKVGALSEIEYRNECAMENARARYEESHDYLDEGRDYGDLEGYTGLRGEIPGEQLRKG